MEGQQGQDGRAPRGPDRFWDVYSRYYDCVYHLMPYRNLLWDVYKALELEDGMRVLDAGCGTGNFEHFIAEKNPPQVSIDAVDFSSAMLARARDKCRDVGFADFAQADLNAPLPYPDHTFDRIVSVNVLYALPDRDFTMREFLRVLKPDGRMVVTSPLPEFSMRALIGDHFRRVGNIWGAGRKTSTVLRTLRVLATAGLSSVALNVLVINRRESEGVYESLDYNGFHGFLESHSAHGVRDFDIRSAFSGQNLLAIARKAYA